ncbi:hypothetical protein GE061_006300 [Apolygus lucorum]|uniref:limulus clotting factor C n=1 Tax=Apolygus lucorum TaxID=248454 RepID=A0A8S9WV77_APOLU|nr:hypothetical protein GE061_006300 [Apolygus lucorum]
MCRVIKGSHGNDEIGFSFYTFGRSSIIKAMTSSNSLSTHSVVCITLILSLYHTTADEDYNMKGLDCQAMSSPSGKCLPLNECMMHEDVKNALINNTTLPYYFDYVHDKMACGFANGTNTLICCENDPIEIAPSVNMLIPPDCGVQAIATSRIVGGKPVTEPGTFPWLAELMYNRSTGEQTWECGGVLVSHKHILTAAHCANPKGLVMHKARIGALTLDGTGENYWQEHLVKTVREHKEYKPSTKKNDIAVAVLATKVAFTQFVHPICLPYQQEMIKDTFEKKHPFIAGWGRVSYDGSTSERLLQVQLMVRSNDECQGIYRKWNRQITPKHLCAGEADGVHDTCRGDSGAPLMQPIGNYFYVIGLVSYGYYCAVKGYPSVNVRITEYIDWIAENVYDD